jgi:hypothetical protein
MRIAELEKRLDERDELRQIALQAALAAAEQAREIERGEVQRWRDAANEWRAAMEDRERRFATREMVDSRSEANRALIGRNTDDLAVLSRQMATVLGRSGGLSAGWGYLVGAVGVVATVISIGALLLRH